MSDPGTSHRRSAKEIFFEALDKNTAAERAAFLDGACGKDPVQRAKVEALLADHFAQDVFMKEPAQERERGTIKLDPAPAEVPAQMIGRYKLLQRIGEGGFGEVWMAEQREPVKRRVALKIIKLGMDSRQIVARFEAERQALAMMDHPNIAKIFDAGTTESIIHEPEGREGHSVRAAAQPSECGVQGTDPPCQSAIANRESKIQIGRPYFVMELVRGIKITEYCDQNQLPTRDRLDLFISVCRAIQHAHQKGIIHRDIKPSNVLVTLHDGAPVPKVIDFGIAKATQQELTDKTVFTQFQQFIGTPAYISPEQAEMSGLDIDTRADIYSLGVLLYELLVGQTPFDAKEMMQGGLDALRQIIREKEPLRPSTKLNTLVGDARTTAGKCRQTEVGKLVHQLQGDLDWIVMKCLEKDRARRYETANGLVADLKRHLNNEPVVARPPSSRYRMQKAWRRHRLLFAAGATVAAALVVGVVGTSLGLIRAERERANAQESARRETVARLEAQGASALALGTANTLKTNLYSAQIALAHREITSYPANVRQAEALLQLCAEDLRNWEWHYLKRRRFQVPTELQAFGEQKAHCVAFSPDNRYLAAGGGDGTVRIWHSAAWRLEHTLSVHTGFVAAVAFSPVDPFLIATAGSDRQVKLLNWRDGRELHSWPASITKDYEHELACAVAFSPDGRRLTIPSDGSGGAMVVYDTGSGDEILNLPGHEEGERCVAFSPDSRWIATGTVQGAVHLWDAGTGKQVTAFGGNSPPTTAVAFAARPLRLVALQIDGTVRTWDVTTHQELSSFRTRQAGSPTVGLALHAGADRVVTGGLDRLVTVSDPATGEQLLVLRELASECYGLAFSPDGYLLAAASRSGVVHVWDGTPLTGGEHRNFREVAYSSDEVWAIDVAPTGRSLAVGGYHSKGDLSAPVMVWDIPAFSLRRELPGFPIIVFSLAYDASGRFLAAAGDEPVQPGKAKLKVWDLESHKEAYEVEAFQPKERFASVAFSPAGRWLVAGGNASQLRVWSATTGRKLTTLGSHSNMISQVTFSTNGRYLASIGNDDVVNVWDGAKLDQPQPEPRRFRGLCVGITDLIAFSLDESRLAIVASDDSAILHDLDGDDRKVIMTERGHRPLALAFDPSGRWVASGGGDGTARLWDASTGRLRDTLRGHIDQVTRLKFLQRPEGLWLISGSRDGTVKFWDITRLALLGESP